jgi:hypothetical protein
MGNLKITGLILFLLFTSICHSQSGIDSTKDEYNNTIQFYIVNEVIAAYKLNISENSSLRFIFNATGLFTDLDRDNTQYYERQTDTTVYIDNARTRTSDQFFEIKIQYLYNIELNKIINLYFGGGPFVNYNFYQREDWNERYYPGSNDIYKNHGITTENNWSVGISAVAGLEYTVYKSISLFVEYEADVSRGWQTRDYSSTSQANYTNDYETNIWTYELKGIRIGAGISF